ncbi:unnamed protein product [Gongylonema pulchrum]|uniref:Protein kinase domain-containing protein n=1 Tax=Gongylonema pulchrum TaxID=637853 RepID=A0A183DRX7_9BILA|nr:unnamed protein product [Gongylonema pulchrum]
MDDCGTCDRCIHRPCIAESNREYEEHGVIGKGAYGIVYLVTHVPSNKQVLFFFPMNFR